MDGGVTVAQMGISGVFLALIGIFVIMILIGRLFRERKDIEAEAVFDRPTEIESTSVALGDSGGEPATVDANPSREPATVEADPSREPATVEAEDEPFVLPVTPITLVPASLISGATLALHLYDKGELALGETRRFEVDGIKRTVTLLAAGYMNRARVDGEEIAFMLTRVAEAE